jgi:hypothetical protein
MLHAERRHTKKCNERQERRAKKNPDEPLKLPPKELKKCDCPLWVVGVDLRGEFHRHSLDTQDLTTAIRIQKLELGEPITKPQPALEIDGAYEKYKAILQAQRGVKDNSLYYSCDVTKRAILMAVMASTICLDRQECCEYKVDCSKSGLIRLNSTAEPSFK